MVFVDFINNYLPLKVVLAALLAFFVSFFAMPKIIRVAIKKEMVAKPNHRTSHKGRIPNIGGVSIYLGFFIAILFFANMAITIGLQFFLMGLTIMFFIGLQDDILIISPKKKLLGEIIAVLAMLLFGDIRFSNFHHFLGITDAPYVVSLFVSLFIIIVIINALNLIDGIDGLASGVGILSSLFFGFFFLYEKGVQTTEHAILAFCLLGALVPFFLFNVFGKRSKIFMGDAGALSLGFIIAYLTIQFCEININVGAGFFPETAPAMAICVLILPLFDTLRIFIIRTSQGKSPLRPDKNHLHHNLLALGFTHKQSTSILLSCNAIFIVIGIVGRNLPGWLLLSIVIVLAVAASEFLRFKLKQKHAKEQRKRQVYNPITTEQTQP